MFNNPYMYTSFTPNMYGMPMATNAVRGASIPISNAVRGATIPIGNAVRGMSAVPAGMNMARGTGLFSRLGGAIKGINWSGFINNASKTVGVINQTIPLVKQAGPMIRNMKSVMKVASVFKDETDPKPNKNTQNNYQKKSITTNNTLNYNSQDNNDLNTNQDNSPVFFVS